MKTLRCAVVLGKGKYLDELGGFGAGDGPREEFVEIARATGAQLLSYTSQKPARGKWFAALFENRPVLGSAVAVALRGAEFDRFYATGEDVAFPLAFLLRLRGWRGKIVCRVHNMTPKKSKLLRFIGHGPFAALITTSAEQARQLTEEHGIPAEKVLNVRKWVDEAFFRPAASKPVRARPLVLACGAENRDYATLAGAAAGCDADFEVYGHGYFGENASKFQSSNVPANLKLMPRVPFEELARAYSEADVIALPVNDVGYAAGVTGLVEAMAAGQAVVASRTHGLSEYLAMIDDDLVAAPHDPDAMRAAIERALADPARLERIGRENREWVLGNAALERYVERVKTIMLA